MRIIRDVRNWPQAAYGSVMALGNFDGMHPGHIEVISKAYTVAKEQNRPCAVMSFEPHPRRFFSPEKPLLRIIPLSEKIRALEACGVEWLFLARFNAVFSRITAQEFVDDVLLKQLRVAHVVTGYNFGFGYNRSGNSDFLQARADQKGFTYSRISEVKKEDTVSYSSSAIREALRAGDMQKTCLLLGRNYSITGRVIQGDKRGRQLGFPTANIRMPSLWMPALGVYAVRVTLESGKVVSGVANLGNRPTVDGSRCLLEAHLFDISEDLYGQRLKVELLQFIRAEQKFSGLDALKSQIAHDVLAARVSLEDVQ